MRYAAPLLIVAAVAVIASLYVGAMRARTDGHLSLPLDDGYIYLQYAKRLAQGHALSYTEGAPPSTGATSWLHTMLLAVPFVFGVDGEDAIWASIVLGACYLALAAWLAVKIVLATVPGVPGRLAAFGAAAAVLLNPTLVHGVFSGMDTALYAAALLAVAFALCRAGATPAWGWVAAALLAWVRPEGLLMGGVAMLAFRHVGAGRVRAIALAAIVACVPLAVGWALTGTPKSDVLALKGVFSIPESSGRAAVLASRPENWLRQVTWLLTNFRNPGAYPAIQYALMASFGAAVVAAWRAGLRAITLLGAFVVLGVLATSLSWFTLARYTAPYLPLLVVVAAFGFARLVSAVRSGPPRAALGAVVLGAAGLFVWTPLVPIALDEFSWHCQNSHAQQRRVGEWLRDNTHKDAVVAVNDAGAIAYFSGRRIIDLVGLTSHGWAETSHVRPGATFEKLENLPPDERPDVLAVYDEVFPNLLRTGIVGKPLLLADLDNNTINLSRLKVVCSTNWERGADRRAPQLTPRATSRGTLTIVDAVNVADLDSERAHDYVIRGGTGSFVLDLPSGAASAPHVLEGGRSIAGAEEFAISVAPGRDVIVIARVFAESRLDAPVRIGGTEVARLSAPAQTTGWSECSARIDGAAIRAARVTLTIGEAGAPGRQIAHYWFAQ